MTQRSTWRRAVAAYSSFAVQKPVWVIAPALALALTSLWFASSRLGLDARLQALLPQDTPVQRARQEAERRVVNRAPLVLMVHSSDPSLNRRVTKQIARRLSSWPQTHWVTRKRDLQFFLDRRLLYLPAAKLRSLADGFEARLDWERCSRNPLCVPVEDRPKLPRLQELRSHYRAFEELTGSVDLSATPASSRPKALGELCSDDGRTCLVKALMKGEPSDLSYAKQILGHAERLLEAVTPARPPDGFRLRVVGGYEELPRAQASAVNNLTQTALLSLTLVLVIVVLQFHGGRAFALLFGPLAIGAAWAAGLAAWFDPELNLMAAYTLAVLGGMGIDYGIHLTTKYGALRREGLGVAAAALGTLRTLGVSLPTAALTTAAGFLALISARFRGLSQLGLLAAMGIGTVVLAYALLFPALVALFHRCWPERRALTRALPWPTRQPSRRSAAVIVLIGLLLAGVGGLLASNLELEYDYDKLRVEDASLGIDWNSADQVMRGNAVLMMADSAGKLEAAAEGLRRESRDRRSAIGWVVSPGLFVPRDQRRRLHQIGRLRSVLDTALAKVDGDLRRKIAAFRPLLDVNTPITKPGLPGWIKPLIGERNGDLGKLGIAYVRLPGRDARAMELLGQRIEGWSQRYPGVRFFAISAMLGEVTSGLREDAPGLLLLALAGIMLAVGLAGRSLTRVGTVIASLLVSTAVTTGLMVICGWKIHLYNLAALPLIFGIGVDSAIYVVWSFGGRAEARWSEVVTTSRAVVGCAVTTMAGFGGMMIASNPGLRSFGQLAALGIGASLLANLIWLPALLLLLRKRAGGGDAERPSAATSDER
jgi:predicted RND superfamily exporter protein